eukprot:TRINITY_DN2040_c0_g1_i1.p1 TRINITY_DN2040_c0_g1~~TRINITY_DN2040_c0_g1_i1.p1  ORF type:complete len:266 (-),score=54.87 TRINITY_DN2040_c0_g1_i1:10-807(-)
MSSTTGTLDNRCPYTCPSGRCVDDITRCQCSIGFYCLDGTCQVECPSLPVSIVFDRIQAKIESTNDTRIEFPVGRIRIPRGIFDEISMNAVVQVDIVPLSVIRASILNSFDDNLGLSRVLSTPIRITLSDDNGPLSSVSFRNFVEISLNIQSSGSTSICLAFINNQTKWQCVDKNLVISRNKNITMATGKTNHFTDFAILFNGNENSSREAPPKGESVPPEVGIIVGVIAGVFVMIGIIAVIVYKRKQLMKEREILGTHTEATSA